MSNCNPGLEFVKLNLQFEAARHGQIADQTEQMRKLQSQIDRLAKLVEILTNCKPDKKADFENNPEVREIIDQIRAIDKNLILPGKYSWNGEQELDAVLSVLNAKSHLLSGETQEKLMYIRQHFDELGKFSEIASRALDTVIEYIKSILAKTR